MSLIKTNIDKIGDPFILLHNGVYYHYSTSSPLGFKVFTSTNLIDWKDEGLCYQDSKVGYMDFWAPEVVYRNNQFYMFFSSKNKTKDKLLISVAISQSPLGPFIDVKEEPTFDFGYAAIDATLFTDDDGKHYMYFARDCSENIVNGVHTSQIYGVRLENDLITPLGEPVLLLTPEGDEEQRDPMWQWNEGPAMLKHNGKYYLSYSYNCFADKRYSVSYAISDKPLGGFIKIHQPILEYNDKISGPGHNSYFIDKKGQLMTAFHIHTNYDVPSGDRTTCFAKCEFIKNKLFIDYI